jgi:hypothetical protein
VDKGILWIHSKENYVQGREFPELTAAEMCTFILKKEGAK